MVAIHVKGYVKSTNRVGLRRIVSGKNQTVRRSRKLQPTKVGDGKKLAVGDSRGTHIQVAFPTSVLRVMKQGEQRGVGCQRRNQGRGLRFSTTMQTYRAAVLGPRDHLITLR